MSDGKPVAWRWKEDNDTKWRYGDSIPMAFNRSRHSWTPLHDAAALAAARRQALEEAARVCEARFPDTNYQWFAARKCADAIRALIEETPCKS